jgi:hypothetical protein
MTPEALRGYDARVQYVDVIRADSSTYCLESTIDGRSAFKNGPGARVALGTCAAPEAGMPVAVHTPEDSMMRVRAAVPAMEAYNADHRAGYKGRDGQEAAGLRPRHPRHQDRPRDGEDVLHGEHRRAVERLQERASRARPLGLCPRERRR